MLGLRDIDYDARLKALNQYSIRGRLLRADLIYCWKMFHGKCAMAPADIFTVTGYGVTRGHRYKVDLPRTQTDIRKRSFGVRCVTTWNQLPDCVVSMKDLSAFKARLADCLGDNLFRYHQ